MSWHYVDEAGNQAGPVEENAFQLLVREGKISPATHVWRQGMSEWQSYGSVAGSAPAPAEMVVCTVSGKSVPKDEAVQIGGAWISQAHKAEYLQTLKEGVSLPGARHYAGFWIRFGAKIIDGLIIGIPGALIQGAVMALLIHATAKGAAADSKPVFLAMGVSFLINFSLGVSYSVFMVGKYGATLGKMACGLRVVRAGGDPLGYGLAAGRYFAELLNAITLYIGYLMVAFDDEKRGLHDRICNTRVIKKARS